MSIRLHQPEESSTVPNVQEHDEQPKDRVRNEHGATSESNEEYLAHVCPNLGCKHTVFPSISSRKAEEHGFVKCGDCFQFCMQYQPLENDHG